MTRIKNVNCTLRQIADSCPELVFGTYLKGTSLIKQTHNVVPSSRSMATDKSARHWWRGSGDVIWNGRGAANPTPYSCRMHQGRKGQLKVWQGRGAVLSANWFTYPGNQGQVGVPKG